MPDPAWSSTLGFLGDVFLFPILALAIVAAGRYFSPGVGRRPESLHERIRPLAGLTGLLLLPAALVGLSYAAQPAMMGRYALPAIAAVGPIVALTACGMERIRWAVVCLVLLLLGSYNLAGVRRYMETRDARWDRLAEWLEAEHADGAVLFELRDDLYPLCRITPSAAGRFYFEDFSDTAPGRQSRRAIVERDVARNHHRLYGWPQLLTPDDLGRLEKVSYVASRPDPGRVSQQFPGFSVRNIRGNVFELSRIGPSERAQFRAGLGMNWLDDPIDTDLGFNFTYGADFFPGRPWILSATLDWGTLGSAELFRFRTSVGEGRKTAL
jgi:hypothetical protein